MRIIKHSPACEVAQNATSTLFSFTKQSFLPLLAQFGPSLCLPLSLSFLTLSLLVFLHVLTLWKQS